MKIDGSNPLSGKMQVGFNEEAPSSVQERAEASGLEQTELQGPFSPNNLQSLKSQLDKLPAVRQNKVQALQQAIQNGSYEIDNYKLADAISAEFFGPGRQVDSLT